MTTTAKIFKFPMRLDQTTLLMTLPYGFQVLAVDSNYMYGMHLGDPSNLVSREFRVVIAGDTVDPSWVFVGSADYGSLKTFIFEDPTETKVLTTTRTLV